MEIPVIPKEAFCAYFKYRIRRAIDFPLASVATMLIMDGTQKICTEARVIIGAVGPKPEEVKGIQEILKEESLDSSLIEEASDLAFRAAKPIANVGSSPSYRRRMVKVFVKEAFRQALGGFA